MNRHATRTKLPHGSARRHIVATLAQEIMSNPSEKSFPVGSEYHLCRRFSVSRVTVRLALEDLKNRGLIYPKHGVGTFAHGQSTRLHRYIGILVDIAALGQSDSLRDFLSGAQAYAEGRHCALLVIDQTPDQWRPELATMLSGVVLMLEEVSPQVAINLQLRKLPYLIVGKTGLSLRLDQITDADTNGASASPPPKDFFGAGQQTVQLLLEEFWNGALSASNASSDETDPLPGAHTSFMKNEHASIPDIERRRSYRPR